MFHNILISCLVSFTWCTNLFCQNKVLIWVGFLCHRNCAKLLVDCHMAAAAESKLRVIYCKFSNPDRGSVALFTPAKCFQATWSWRNDQNRILYPIHILVLNWISESSDLVNIFEYILTSNVFSNKNHFHTFIYFKMNRTMVSRWQPWLNLSKFAF